MKRMKNARVRLFDSFRRRMRMDKTLLNQEGYADPTAHDAVANVTKEEELKRIRIREEEITLFIKTIKRLAKSQHLRILNRIELLDMETGKKYL